MSNPQLTPSNDQFGLLLTQHVKRILESGLLLDEDYEVLLNASNFKIYSINSHNAPVGLIATTLTTLGSVFVATKFNRPVYAVPSLAATLAFLYLESRRITKGKRRNSIVDSVTRNFIKLRKLNTTVLRYLKLRKKCSKEVTLYNGNVLEFVHYFISQYKSYFGVILKEIHFLVKVTPELLDDYEGVKELDIEAILDDNLSPDNLEIETAKVQDIYMFIASKFLNYLGLCFCRNLRHFELKHLENLLDKKLPMIDKNLCQLFHNIQKEFNNLKYCTSKKLQIEKLNSNCFTKKVSGKLQDTLTGAVNNLSLIMEKSSNVLGKVGDLEEERDFVKMESCLKDLRDHAFATYESLDVLCKLYGILSDANRSSEDRKVNVDLNLERSENSETVNYDDTTEAVEENYELFIPENEHSNVTQEICEDQSVMYLGLMLKELRQSLKQHERFIAARSKRGVGDDEEEIREKSEKQVKVPKFNLTPEESQIKGPVPAPRLCKLPPPPPPLPIPQLDENSSGSKSLLENIKTLSSQLKGKEEVFGDDFDGDEDSD